MLAASNALPDILQEAQIEVIGTAECDTLMQGVSGVRIWDNHLCLFDRAEQTGSCNVSRILSLHPLRKRVLRVGCCTMYNR